MCRASISIAPKASPIVRTGDGPLLKGSVWRSSAAANSGVEAAIDPAGIAEHVTLLEFAPETYDQGATDKVRSPKNVDIILNAQNDRSEGRRFESGGAGVS